MQAAPRASACSRSYVDDDEDLGPLDVRRLVDLHGRVGDGLDLGALGVLADDKLLAGAARPYPEVLPVERLDLHSLRI